MPILQIKGNEMGERGGGLTARGAGINRPDHIQSLFEKFTI